jgi:AraC-like DNA-binding protein
LSGRKSCPRIRSITVAHAMDPLSDVLRSVRLTGGVFLDARFTAPWSVSGNMTAEDCRAFLASPTHAPAQIIAYHVVIAGKLLAAVEGEPAMEVSAGEIVLIPRNDVNCLSSAAGLKPRKARDLVRAPDGAGLPWIRHGGGGEATHIVCGFLAGDDAYHPLIATLPRLLKIDIREATSRDWIEASIRFAAGELTQGRVAAPGTMSRLAELLFVEAVRRYAETLPDEHAGWLRGLKDPQIGRALALIHQDIGAPWSAEALAHEVALSRSAFMDRFSGLVGMPPIRYLTVWRLHTARLRLRETSQSIGQLAHAVGYASEEAFSRAFRREFGVSPGRWRESGAEGR